MCGIDYIYFFNGSKSNDFKKPPFTNIYSMKMSCSEFYLNKFCRVVIFFNNSATRGFSLFIRTNKSNKKWKKRKKKELTTRRVSRFIFLLKCNKGMCLSVCAESLSIINTHNQLFFYSFYYYLFK